MTNKPKTHNFNEGITNILRTLAREEYIGCSVSTVLSVVNYVFKHELKAKEKPLKEKLFQDLKDVKSTYDAIHIISSSYVREEPKKKKKK